VKRLLALAAAAVFAPSASTAAAADLPQQWDPHTVAVNHEDGNAFLLRPGQILAGPGDAPIVAKFLPGWRQAERRPYGVTLFTTTPTDSGDPAKEVMGQVRRIRSATGGRVQVAPNYVFVGESVPGTAEPINFMGEPRIQGGPGSSVRLATPPRGLPLRTERVDDGAGVRIAVLDTGLFAHPWLSGVAQAPDSADVWDVNGDGYADAESGHGTFIAGLIREVAPAASVYVAKVLNSHGVGDDFTVAQAIEALPNDVDIINLSLGGYTDHDEPPMAIEKAVSQLKTTAVVAAAGNNTSERRFWPAAFEDVLAVGAVENLGGKWGAADYSNFGDWVDATARGTNLQSTFGSGRTRVASGLVPSRLDPIVTFRGWSAWDGTSFSTPITAALIAREMSRERLPSAALAEEQLLANAPAAGQAEFPNAVFLDELEGRPDPNEAGAP
jgi:subtilase family protein